MTYETRFNPDDSPRASLQIVKTVAELTGQPATDLCPLYNVLDPDALNRLVGSNKRSADLKVFSFIYHGYLITVDDTGRIVFNKQ